MSSGGADRVYATPAGVILGPLDAIADGGARNYVLEMRAGRFHGFVVREGTRVFGYVDRCPHMGLPLAQQLDAYLSPDGELIQCSWHGALFRIDDGACVAGARAGARLRQWPIEAAGDVIRTA